MLHLKHPLTLLGFLLPAGSLQCIRQQGENVPNPYQPLHAHLWLLELKILQSLPNNYWCPHCKLAMGNLDMAELLSDRL